MFGDGITIIWLKLGKAMVSKHAVELPRSWKIVFAVVQGICTSMLNEKIVRLKKKKKKKRKEASICSTK